LVSHECHSLGNRVEHISCALDSLFGKLNDLQLGMAAERSKRMDDNPITSIGVASSGPCAPEGMQAPAAHAFKMQASCAGSHSHSSTFQERQVHDTSPMSQAQIINGELLLVKQKLQTGVGDTPRMMNAPQDRGRLMSVVKEPMVKSNSVIKGVLDTSPMSQAQTTNGELLLVQQRLQTGVGDTPRMMNVPQDRGRLTSVVKEPIVKSIRVIKDVPVLQQRQIPVKCSVSVPPPQTIHSAIDIPVLGRQQVMSEKPQMTLGISGGGGQQQRERQKTALLVRDLSPVMCTPPVRGVSPFIGVASVRSASSVQRALNPSAPSISAGTTMAQVWHKDTLVNVDAVRRKQFEDRRLLEIHNIAYIDVIVRLPVVTRGRLLATQTTQMPFAIPYVNHGLEVSAPRIYQAQRSDISTVDKNYFSRVEPLSCPRIETVEILGDAAK